MARRRYQCPTPKVENGWWCIRYRIDEIRSDGSFYRPQRYKRLAEAKTPIREVLKRRDEFLAPFNTGAVNAGAAVRFRDYATLYEQTNLPLLSHNSQGSYRSTMDTYLLPAFGKLLLRDINSQTAQGFFTRLAVVPRKMRCGKAFRTAVLKLSSRRKIWSWLSAILGTAVAYKCITVNPTANIKLDTEADIEIEKPFITLDMFFALLKLIQEPYATAVFADVLTGLRPSELFALPWKNVHDDSFKIEKKFSRGHWGRPKTKKSADTIEVDPVVIERIRNLKTLKVSIRAGTGTRVVDVVKSCGPDDLVFQAVYDGGPMNADNILHRHIKPAGKILGIPWVNWQCLRRSCLTWHVKAGTHPKVAQKLARHSNFGTTMNVYAQVDREGQREAVAGLARYVGVKRQENSSPDQLTLWGPAQVVITEGSKMVN